MCKGQVAIDTAVAWNLQFDPDQSDVPGIAVAESAQCLGMANRLSFTYRARGFVWTNGR